MEIFPLEDLIFQVHGLTRKQILVKFIDTT